MARQAVRVGRRHYGPAAPPPRPGRHRPQLPDRDPCRPTDRAGSRGGRPCRDRPGPLHSPFPRNALRHTRPASPTLSTPVAAHFPPVHAGRSNSPARSPANRLAMLLDEPAAGLTEAEQADLARRRRSAAERRHRRPDRRAQHAVPAAAGRPHPLPGRGPDIAEGTPDASGATPPWSPHIWGRHDRRRHGHATAPDPHSLSVGYGGAPVVNAVSLDLRPDEVLALLGANGAGKSSLMRAVIGLEPAASGRILLDGVDITYFPPERRARMGLGYVPEGRRVFPGMSVRDNLEVASFAPYRRQSALSTSLHPVSPASGEVFRPGVAAFRRTAADARHRPRPDGRTAPASAGRTFHGAVARA